MTIWGNIVKRLRKWPIARKWIIGSLAVLVLVTVVFFGDDVQHLWRWLRGQAEGGPTWVTHSEEVPQDTMHGKTIVIDHPNGKRYLYTIGGVEFYNSGVEKRLRLLDNVQRIELDENGKIKESVQWEGGTTPATDAKWMHMYSGHAEFGVYYLHLSDKHWLYVVSGDIHVPDIDDTEIANPLLFSTIEKLELTADETTDKWEPVAIVTGVNFYPEVIEYGNQFHIVGGVYGNPFGKYTSTTHKWYNNYYDYKDPLLPTDDVTKWNDPVLGYDQLRRKDNWQRTLGPVGVSIEDGGLGDDIFTGGVVGIKGPGQGTILGMGNKINLADYFSKALLNGSFATTVSEHYAITLTDFTNQHIGELGNVADSNNDPKSIEEDGGNDYLGKLISTWVEYNAGGRVTHLGHLRIGIASFFFGGDTTYYVYPAPQGRYGHKLVVAGSAQNLYVLGGAAWSTKIILYGGGTVPDTEISPFWVLEDDMDPISRAFPSYIPWYVILPSNPNYYRFVGNISYQWNSADKVWGGTNTDLMAGIATKFFDTSKFAPLSGAFFSLAKLAPESGVTEWLAVGGLANDDIRGGWNDTWQGDYKYWPALCNNGSKWGISVEVTNRSERYSSTAKQWQQTDLSADAPGPNFGANAAGMGGYAIVLGGQSTFQGSIEGSEAPFNDDHVPDLLDTIITQDQTYQYTTSAGGGGSWKKLGDFNIDTVFYPFGNVLSEAGASSGKTIYLYKISGGFPSGTTFSLSPKVEWLGPFTYGMPGVVDPAHSTIVIDPLRDSYTEVDIDGVDTDVPTVWNDHYDYATATISLKDYYGAPVISDADNTVTVSIYTSRSSAPAIDKYGSPDYYRDDIRIDPTLGTAYSGTVPTGWTNQLVEVDGNGQATFRMLSGFATDADAGQPIYEDVRGYVYIDSGDAAQQQTGVGWAPLIFTREDHPVTLTSSLTADPFEVTADLIDQSTLTATVKDWNNQPLPGFVVKVESARNLAQPDTDIFDSKTLTPGLDGTAQTKVKSAVVDFAVIAGYYDISEWTELPNALDLPKVRGFKTTLVKFSLLGRFISLIPSSGKQSQTLSPLVAVGENTKWRLDSDVAHNTKVDFIAPNSWFNLDGPGDINKLYLVADGISITKLMLTIPTPNADVTVKIVSGGGYLLGDQDNDDQILLHTNTEGTAYFQYEASATAGILKMEATYAGGNTSKLWLPLLEKNIGFLGMTISANPPTLSSAGQISDIYAKPTNFTTGIPADKIEWTTYETDDGSLEEYQTGTAPNDAYIRLHYTPGSTIKGVAKVFVIGTYDKAGNDNRKIIRMVTITKDFAVTGGNQDITFVSAGSDGQPTDLSIPTPTSLTSAGGIRIGNNAVLGVWGFVARTMISEPDPDNPGYNHDVTYWEMAPFTVYAGNLPTGPYINQIIPPEGWRGDQDLQVTIVGSNTNFKVYGSDQSVVTFTAYNTANGGNTTGVTATVISVSTNAKGQQELVTSVDIAKDATVGYWNVKVTTGSVAPQEVAEMGGNLDFLVTTSTGYFVDLTAVPPGPFPRDGFSASTLAARVGQVDVAGGSIINQNNKLVTFSFLPTDPDNGYIDPGFATTNSNGIAQNDYYCDLGIEDDTDTIEAAAKISDTLTVYGTVIITKIGVGEPDKPNGLKSTIEALTPVQIDPDGGEPGADGDPYSEVTVVVKNSSGVPLKDKSVKLESDRPTPPDHIKPTPSYLITNDQGEVVFWVSSGQAGFSTVTATITEGAIQLSHGIRFTAEGVLVPRVFKVTVPFQARDYDNRVLVVIKDNNWSIDGDTDLEKEYTKNARNADSPDQPPNYLPGLYTEGTGPVFWLYPNRTFTVWVKGKQHLAMANPSGVINSGTSLQKEDIVVDFTTVNGGRGLLAGDIFTASTEVYPGYHDNVVGKFAGILPADDLKLLVDSWFKITDIYLPDINFDGIVNSIDVLYGLANLGDGAPRP